MDVFINIEKKYSDKFQLQVYQKSVDNNNKKIMSRKVPASILKYDLWLFVPRFIFEI